MEETVGQVPPPILHGFLVRQSAKTLAVPTGLAAAAAAELSHETAVSQLELASVLEEMAVAEPVQKTRLSIH
jgi:hypothetical protein